MRSKDGKRRWRVFLGFVDIAQYQHFLKVGLERHGCTVRRFAWQNELQFSDGDNDRYVIWRWLSRARTINQKLWQKVAQTPKTSLVRLCFWVTAVRLSAIWKKAMQWAFLLWAIARHDVIVMSFNGSFLEWYDHVMEPGARKYLDLKLIKACRRKLISTFHGSDSRPPYLDGYVLRNPRQPTAEHVVALTRARRRAAEAWERFADVIVNVPAQAYFFTRRFVLHEYLGRPFEPTRADSGTTEKSDRPVLLHAPSSTFSKGTQEFHAILKRLRERGEDFEYVEIVRRPHAELIAALKRADLVVDQLYSDRMVTGIATDAMAYGVPVIIGGYYADYYRKDYDGRMPLPPVVFCRPEEIEQAVLDLLHDRARREELGRLGREYVKDYFSPEAVAQRWLDMFENRLPPVAWYDPHDLRYPLGCALPIEEARRSVQNVLKIGGREALCLSDKPELERAVVALAES